MHSHSAGPWHHDHVFLGENAQGHERRTWIVVGVTLVAMVAEVGAGLAFGSMALLADGLHMATHAGALTLAGAAYAYARRNANNPRFAFGTGKVGDLAAFASAVILATVALLVGWESLERLAAPTAIDYSEATAVAVAGLLVNLGSAWLLHPTEHSHEHGASHHHHDHNLRGAYLHVLADALTSVLAIAALLAGAFYGWTWLDPAVGLVGAIVIGRWSIGLMKDSGAVLLDASSADLSGQVRAAVETHGDRVLDLHVWRVGPGHHAAILSVLTERPCTSGEYKARLQYLPALCHLTVEVHEWIDQQDGRTCE